MINHKLYYHQLTADIHRNRNDSSGLWHLFKKCASLQAGEALPGPQQSPDGEGDKAKRKEQVEKRLNLKSTCRRRAFIVARVDAVPENYVNFTQLLGTLNLATLDKDFGVVCDLKVIDILVGLQSTSSRHCCPYCKGNFSKNGLWNLDAERRDFENMTRDYERYRAEANNRRRLKEFNSVEFPPIIMHSDQIDKRILELLPPPELHAGLLGPVNQTIQTMSKTVPGMADFLRENNIKGSVCKITTTSSQSLRYCV